MNISLTFAANRALLSALLASFARYSKSYFLADCKLEYKSNMVFIANSSSEETFISVLGISKLLSSSISCSFMGRFGSSFYLFLPNSFGGEFRFFISKKPLSEGNLIECSESCEIFKLWARLFSIISFLSYSVLNHSLPLFCMKESPSCFGNTIDFCSGEIKWVRLLKVFS